MVMRTLCFLIILAILPAGLIAQRALEKANEAFERLEYAKAIEWYQKALENRQEPEAVTKLAHCFRLTNQYKTALIWYARAAQDPFVAPETKLYYAQMLLIQGNKDEADRWALAFLQDKPGDQRGLALREGIRQARQVQQREARFSIGKAPFSAQAADDYAPVYYPGGLVFTSDRGAGDKADPWTGRPFSGLFFAAAGGAAVTPLRGAVQSNFHDGAACFTDNGHTMYFTRSNRRGKGSNDEVRLTLEAAELDGGAWRLRASFPYNSKDFNTGHPALSKDGNTLVFASDRPGTLGEMDLYMCKFVGGAWSQPMNLGPVINTPGTEAFPFLTDDGQLVFASNGHPGIGGMDLFVARQLNGQWQKPENLGFPLNSPGDDFSLVATGDLMEGYFATNRDSDTGLDDIYTFSQSLPANELTVQVVDKYTRIPLPGVQVEVRDRNTGDVATGITNAQGQAPFPIRPEHAYVIGGVKNGVATNTKTETVGALQPGEPRFVELEHNDPRFTLRGQSLTSKAKAPVAGVLVRLTNLRTMKRDSAYSDAGGNFVFQLDQNTDYQLVGEKDGYFTTVGTATTKGQDRTTTLYVTLFLSIDVIELTVNNVIDSNLVINGIRFNPIYYDFDKWNIRPDAARELDKLVSILKLNPGIEIELRSHTDCRGDDDYNLKLSQRRAESAAIYMIQKGINGSRIAATGYGETKLRNRCDDGVDCSDEQHQANRRTEFAVVKK